MIILTKRLEDDELLVETTALTPDYVCKLTELCLHSTYFAFQGNTESRQSYRFSSVPLLPTYVIEDFETTADLQSKIWKRYVDDTLAICPHGRNKFLTHINSLHPNITFTLEVEENNQLPFLDILIQRDHTMLKTTVYLTPTNT